ncbi:MAG: KH domain-containing protein [Clostridiales bacterium]|jgi:predicted RNA-binding protein YlqC (UPF0109 family)|nr:KH domain-containing protein [Clostridiales bacterium]
MKELLEFIAKNLVSHPEEVSVTEIREESDRSLTLELRVAKDDMGKVIGRQGKIARAIRAVLKACAVKENMHVSVEIVQ